MDYEYYEHMRNRLRKGDPEEAEYIMHKMMRDMQWRENSSQHEKIRNQMFLSSILFIILIAVTVLSFYLLPSFKGILEAEKEVKQYQARGIKIIPNLEKRIGDLDKKITTLTTKEVSERLNRIEKTIKAGNLNSDDIKTLQELREDFKVLKEYMFSDPKKIVEYRSLQKNYIQLKSTIKAGMSRDDIIREIDNIRNLLYLVLAIIGIIVSIFGVVLFQGKNKPINLIPDTDTNNIDKAEVSQDKIKEKKKS